MWFNKTKIMPNIYNYWDCLKFLNDYYLAKKKLNCKFSYEVFAKSAAISSKGFLRNILKGEKKISTSISFKIATAMKFDENQLSFFTTLIELYNMKAMDKKFIQYQKLMRLSLMAKQEQLTKYERRFKRNQNL